jgi:hypothetical protein
MKPLRLGSVPPKRKRKSAAAAFSAKKARLPPPQVAPLSAYALCVCRCSLLPSLVPCGVLFGRPRSVAGLLRRNAFARRNSSRCGAGTGDWHGARGTSGSEGKSTGRCCGYCGRCISCCCLRHRQHPGASGSADLRGSRSPERLTDQSPLRTHTNHMRACAAPTLARRQQETLDGDGETSGSLGCLPHSSRGCCRPWGARD